MTSKTIKPLGIKSYGSICHLPGSRLGPGDHKLNEGQTAILTQKPRDKHDLVIVQEKLDGSNVAVARVGGLLIPLVRSGYPAVSSRFEQHHFFADWVFEHLDRFAFLEEGERLCGEWLAQAHGVRYSLAHEPFVPFDLMRGPERALYADFLRRLAPHGFTTPHELHVGAPLSVEAALDRLGAHGHHGAIDLAEGAVWRVERRGRVDFLGKYVRPGKQDGCYLPELSNCPPVWNWRP
jgi:hypothetical protein